MSSLGNLGECLMDSDAEAIVRARLLRRKTSASHRAGSEERNRDGS